VKLFAQHGFSDGLKLLSAFNRKLGEIRAVSVCASTWSSPGIDRGFTWCPGASGRVAVKRG